ncbi:MAG: aminoglycoside phosphotransferase family protein [Lamprobacter sp.]|uniref:phosphotransferase enzyme family protein n=1 Tax=Lamprobacter sp. TaxID=3100796 RepID=UPI002B25D18A|nr:aminoglycoside phosphotransferase family protein [Lamprobacter sp.]MEA3639401.1 aminoglycoside phosphotransferase family protein [Lamprobacter sp.]
MSTYPLRLSPLGEGLINDTRLVEAGGNRFVLQRINGAVFADADAIAGNLLQVQSWLGTQANTTVRLPRLIRAAGGEATLRDADGQAWRLLEYIDNSRVVKPLENLAQAAEVGRALGRFHAALAGLNPRRLALTLPGLHDTPGYKARLEWVVTSTLSANAADSAKTTKIDKTTRLGGIDAIGHPLLDQTRGSDSSLRRVDAVVASALAQIEARAALIPLLQQAWGDGRLALSVTHGDPKLDNVLFAKGEDRALCLIDLDTVQPGLLHQDVADCLRSCCNRNGIASPHNGQPTDDKRLIGKPSATFDLDLCRALLGGYAELAASLFDNDSIAFLYPAIRLIPLELAIRFLTDYLQGDRYFRVTRPRQNLDKTLIQLALVADIEAKGAEIEHIIDDSFNRRWHR